MVSTSVVKELARQIRQGPTQPPAAQPEVDAVAAQENDDNRANPVRRLTQEVEGREASRRLLGEQVDAAVQDVVREIRACGHVVIDQMEDMAREQALLGKGITMHEQIRRVLLREAAVRSAFKEALEEGVTIHSHWGKEGEARLAATTGGATDYDGMFANAFRALNGDRVVYVVTINGYKRAGVDVILSLSSLADQFEMMVGRETRTAEVASRIREDRLYNRPSAPGTAGPTVKIVGPAGTLLPCEQLVTIAFDCDAAAPEPDAENGVFYSMKVLTDPAQWSALGLAGVTRWKYLCEQDFRDLFGMSKDIFEQLPDWKQIPLKKKHGLF